MSPSHDFAASFERAYQRISSQWQSVQAEWKDAKANDFGKNCMEPLDADLSSMIQQLQELEQAIQYSQQNCRD
jgi:hypothetical protein